MSKDWAADINDMHAHYGFHDKVADLNKQKLLEMMEFRLRFIQEEFAETCSAFYSGDAEEVVDGLIDLCVVAIGTLDLYGVNAHEAWDRVHKCNMAKQVGIKASRPNPLGLPDLIKPEGWVGPVHDDNTGTLKETLE